MSAWNFGCRKACFAATEVHFTCLNAHLFSLFQLPASFPRLAKSTLTGPEVNEVLQRWAEHLSSQSIGQTVRVLPGHSASWPTFALLLL